MLWRAIGGGNRQGSGVFATATVMAPPEPQKDSSDCRAFWIDQTDANSIEHRVPLELNGVARLGHHLERNNIERDPVLKTLTILKSANGTNFRTRTEEAIRLRMLWESRDKPWSTHELKLIEGATLDRVPELSLKLGRSIPDVRRKVAATNLQSFAGGTRSATKHELVASAVAESGPR
jgi:hypothetical protein